MDLKEKVFKFLKIPEDKLGIGCFDHALKLEQKFQGGEIYWVSDIGDLVDMPSAEIGHFYFIPPNANPNDLALNQKDTIYSQYPPLTVEQVKKYGEEL